MGKAHTPYKQGFPGARPCLLSDQDPGVLPTLFSELACVETMDSSKCPLTCGSGRCFLCQRCTS